MYRAVKVAYTETHTLLVVLLWYNQPIHYSGFTLVVVPSVLCLQGYAGTQIGGCYTEAKRDETGTGLGGAGRDWYYFRDPISCKKL